MIKISFAYVVTEMCAYMQFFLMVFDSLEQETENIPVLFLVVSLLYNYFSFFYQTARRKQMPYQATSIFFSLKCLHFGKEEASAQYCNFFPLMFTLMRNTEEKISPCYRQIQGVVFASLKASLLPFFKAPQLQCLPWMQPLFKCPCTCMKSD